MKGITTGNSGELLRKHGDRIIVAISSIVSRDDSTLSCVALLDSTPRKMAPTIPPPVTVPALSLRALLLPVLQELPPRSERSLVQPIMDDERHPVFETHTAFGI